MKALFITILVFAAAFCAYDYFGAPVGQKIIFKSLNVEESEVAAPPPAAPSKTEEKAPPAAPDHTKSAVPVAATEAPPPPPAQAPATVKDPTAPATPKFEPIESLTKNWTFIPKSAFPRQVQLKKAMDFKMSVGSSTLNAGSTVTALGFDQGTLALAPTPTSSARAAAALDDTDIKSVLNEGYEKWKVARAELLRQAQQQRLANKATGIEPPAPVGDPSQAPARSSDGSYPLLVTHLNSGEVSELKAKNIHRWGDPESMHFEGKPAWAVKVQADVETVFGLQPAEAQAIIVGGRVKGWFYTGSGEPVP